MTRPLPTQPPQQHPTQRQPSSPKERLDKNRPNLLSRYPQEVDLQTLLQHHHSHLWPLVNLPLSSLNLRPVLLPHLHSARLRALPHQLSAHWVRIRLCPVSPAQALPLHLARTPQSLPRNRVLSVISQQEHHLSLLPDLQVLDLAPPALESLVMALAVDSEV